MVGASNPRGRASGSCAAVKDRSLGMALPAPRGAAGMVATKVRLGTGWLVSRNSAGCLFRQSTYPTWLLRGDTRYHALDGCLSLDTRSLGMRCLPLERRRTQFQALQHLGMLCAGYWGQVTGDCPRSVFSSFGQEYPWIPRSRKQVYFITSAVKD